MSDFEQRANSHGLTTLRLLKVMESVGTGGLRVFGNILLSEKHYKEGDNEAKIVTIIPISGNLNALLNMRQAAAAEKLSINKVSITVNHRTNSIELGPSQGIHIEESIRGKGITTFVVNEMIRWLKQNFTEYSINPFEVVDQESTSDESIEMRNRFIEKFGFSMSYSDITKRSGTIRAKKPTILKENSTNEKIDELDIEQYVLGLLNDRGNLEHEINNLKLELNTRESEVFKGVSKDDFVKYTIIGSVVTVFLLVLLII